MANESEIIINDHPRIASTEKDDDGHAVLAVSQLDITSLSRGDLGLIKE